MNELLRAFESSEDLMAWCVQHGHIDKELSTDNASELVQHNLIKKLFHDAGIKVLPIIPRSFEEEEVIERNLIDSTLEGDT